MDSGRRKFKVLMLPWLAHGHISPFLELAKRLSSRNFEVLLCSTSVNINSIKNALLAPNSGFSIQFVELHLPSSAELPPHYHTTNGLPPHMMTSLKTAFSNSTSSFSEILKTLKPDILIHDFIPPWAPILASSMNIPAVRFLTNGATMASFTLHHPNLDFPFTSIYLHNHEKEKYQKLIESANRTRQGAMGNDSSLILIKSFRELEGTYLDYLSVLIKKKLVPVGPLIQDLVEGPDGDSEVIKWLDEKEASSTVFVSFGSEYFLSDEEIEEIAYGLEQSKVNFIWVIRFPKESGKIRIEDVIPKEFLSRVGDRANLVENWAPQGRILGHRSVGGFVSHCGWSSLMESMKNGVPVIAMPMHLDQPLNSRLVEEVGIGIEAKRDENGRIRREEVARVIRAVVMEEDETGVEVRRRAKEMAKVLRRKRDEEINVAVRELLTLCKTNL